MYKIPLPANPEHQFNVTFDRIDASLPPTAMAELFGEQWRTGYGFLANKWADDNPEIPDYYWD